MRCGDLREEYEACAEHIEMLTCDLAAADEEIADLNAQLECARAAESQALEDAAVTHMELDGDYEAGKAFERGQWEDRLERLQRALVKPKLGPDRTTVLGMECKDTWEYALTTAIRIMSGDAP